MFELEYSNIDEFNGENYSKKVNYAVNYYKGILDNFDEKSDSAEITQIKNTLQKDGLIKLINYLDNKVNVRINVSQLKEEKIDLNKINKVMSEAEENGLTATFYVEGSSFSDDSYPVPMLFSQNRLDELVDLNNHIVSKGGDGIRFLESDYYIDQSWDFEQVISANSSIDSIVADIKKYNFSEFEAMAYIHLMISSQFEYKEDKTSINPRSFVGALNSDKIVCVGYSMLVKAIVDKLDMPGLKCSLFLSTLTSTPHYSSIFGENISSSSGHMQDFVSINDAKYNINGNYIEDACWDSKNETYPDGKGVAHLLFPVDDLLNYSGRTFSQTQASTSQLSKKAKTNPSDYPVIKENANKYCPINFIKYKRCLKNVISKVNPELTLTQVNDAVEKIMHNSMNVSKTTFQRKAKSTIVKNAFRLELEKKYEEEKRHLEEQGK